MKRFCLRAVLTAALLAALCALSGCGAFPCLSQALRGSPVPFTLEISLDPRAPGGAAAAWDPDRALVDGVDVTVTGEDASPTLSVTILLRPGW